MDRRSLILSVFVACAGIGCTPAPPPLTHARPSPESLGVAVLDALAGRDRAALEALALDEREFRDHVWPALPAARPERNLPFSYVWGDLHQKSQIALAGTLERHGGTRYKLARVSFEGETDYSHYRVHRKARFHVRGESGEEMVLRVCGSMIEKDGLWKVFSYVVD